MTHDNPYYFDNVTDLIQYLLDTHGELSAVKLHKTLYFLYAFYAGIVTDTNLPQYLFPGHFEAWQNGPVMPAVYDTIKANPNAYVPNDYAFNDTAVDNETKQFIDSLSKQVLALSDFTLVNRSREDFAWQDAIAIGKATPMTAESIATEYKQLQLIQ